MDERVQRIEKSLEYLSSSQNEIMMQVKEMFDRLSTRMESMASKSIGNFEGETSGAHLSATHKSNSLSDSEDNET